MCIFLFRSITVCQSYVVSMQSPSTSMHGNNYLFSSLLLVTTPKFRTSLQLETRPHLLLCTTPKFRILFVNLGMICL